ncbi:hypothetical protein TNCV_1610191 [Trichonephila clavipes]|nr:hypothetical protein TNCV_1610191 [Trichonephila clavipes]
MGHTQQVCLRIANRPPSSPQTSGNSFSGDLLSLRQQETDLTPAELWCACSFFADRTIYLSSAGVVLLTRPPRAVYFYYPFQSSTMAPS